MLYFFFDIYVAERLFVYKKVNMNINIIYMNSAIHQKQESLSLWGGVTLSPNSTINSTTLVNTVQEQNIRRDLNCR